LIERSSFFNKVYVQKISQVSNLICYIWIEYVHFIVSISYYVSFSYSNDRIFREFTIVGLVLQSALIYCAIV
jgi:hypothetical protein